jgi:hypothetical protein
MRSSSLVRLLAALTLLVGGLALLVRLPANSTRRGPLKLRYRACDDAGACSTGVITVVLR